MPHGILRDIRYAARGLRRSPGFTLTAVATLALGVGVNVAVFTVTNATLFKGFRSVFENDRILYVDTRDQGRGCCVSYPDFQDWRTQATSFEDMATVADLRVTVSDQSGPPETYDSTLITANAFRILRRQPILGRDFASQDEAVGAAPVAILSHGFWERRYGGDPGVIGRAVRINGAPTEIVGVMGPGFSFPQRQDLWMPLTPTPERLQREARGLWFAFGRLAGGVSAASADAEMQTIGRRLAADYPRTNEGLLPDVHSFSEFFIGPNASAIYGSMLAAVSFVLLIACANLANLLLARAIGRSREISVRVALGAGRARIIRQLLIESLLLSSIGGLFGWWLATLGVRAYQLAANPPSWFAGALDYSMDLRVLAYLVAISLLTGVLFGLAPAGRLSKLDVTAGLKASARGGGAGGRSKSLSTLLLTGEVALAVILLAGAGVWIRSFVNVYSAGVGVKTENVWTAFLRLPDDRYPDPNARISFFESLRARLEANPDLESISMADSLPTWGAERVGYELAGAASVDARRRPKVSSLVVSPAYFQTLAAPVLAGREAQESDGVSDLPAVFVNQQFASASWPGESALGKRLRLYHGETAAEWLTVEGVVPNIVQNDPTRQTLEPVVYVPYRRQPVQAMWILARTRGGPIGAALQRELHQLDPDLPIWLGPFTLADRLAGNYRAKGLNGALFLVFAAVALLLASLGLCAVVAHMVSRQRREIGIRMAMGASTRDVVGLVFRWGMRPLGFGLAIGLAGSLALNRILQSQLVDVSAADPATLLAVVAVLALAASLGCWMPARRAMRIDPAEAIRQD